MSINSDISVSGMLPFLSNRSLADNITVYDTVGSTNDRAKEMIKNGAAHGTVLIARTQTSGKGRHGREFFSPPGSGIYMSLILNYEKTAFLPVTMATVFSAVAVCQAIESLSDAEPRIKWVNDIFMHGRKVGGILTESAMGKQLVVGIGINMSYPAKGFPDELEDIAGAVFSVCETAISQNHLAAEIINRMLTDKYMPDETALISDYRKRLMMLGRTVTVIDGGSSYKAEAIDIDHKGHLIVRDSSGRFITLSHGEISTKI